MRLAFGPFVLDPELGSLARGTSQLPLAPKPFETLVYLARSGGRLVPKTEPQGSLPDWEAAYLEAIAAAPAL